MYSYLRRIFTSRDGLSNDSLTSSSRIHSTPPKMDEMGMYIAYGYSLRSASLSRRVGAAILNADGDVIAVGTNEVPRFKGGLYWAEQLPDYRDFN
jgi:deoxycytidylate deaminase